MKILGMETAVGPRPGALTPRIFTEFNQIFLAIYEELEQKKIIEYQAHNYESKGILRFGDFSLSKVRNWLAYHQLLSVAKIKEPDKKNKDKMITICQLGPTKLGKQAYEDGVILEVDAWQKGVGIGIGKMYPDFESLWNMCLAQAEVDGVAKSRRENWFGTFRDKVFIAKLAAVTSDVAKTETMKWVRGMIAESPRKGHRNKLKHTPNYNAVTLEGEQLLGQQQSLMDFVKTKELGKKKPKPAPKPLRPLPEPVLQPKKTDLLKRLADIHDGRIAKYTKPTKKPQFEKGQKIWVDNEQRKVLATKWCVDGRPEWFYAFEPDGGGMVTEGKTWQIETALQEINLRAFTKEEKASHVKGIIAELQKDPYTFDVRNWKHGINAEEIKKRLNNPSTFRNVSGSRIFTIGEK